MKSPWLALTLLVASPALAKDVVYLANPAQSKIQWSGAKVVGGGHTGKVNIKDATVVFDGDKVKSGVVTVDMVSVVNEDIKEAEWNAKLVGHLKSPDFFDIAAFPTAKLELASVEPQKSGEYLVKGTLTIKGKSLPIQFTALEKKDGELRVVKADLVFDRTTYDIRYGSGKFFANLGDKMIADEVKLSVELTLEPEGKKAAQK